MRIKSCVFLKCVIALFAANLSFQLSCFAAAPDPYRYLTFYEAVSGSTMNADSVAQELANDPKVNAGFFYNYMYNMGRGALMGKDKIALARELASDPSLDYQSTVDFWTIFWTRNVKNQMAQKRIAITKKFVYEAAAYRQEQAQIQALANRRLAEAQKAAAIGTAPAPTAGNPRISDQVLDAVKSAQGGGLEADAGLIKKSIDEAGRAE